MEKLGRISKAALLALTLTMASLMASMSIANAGETPTYAFLSVSPNPVGVNQTVLIVMWLSEPPPAASGPGGDRWKGFRVNITKPDGSTDTLGPFTSDAVGSAWTTYTPDKVGTWYFQFIFPGQSFPDRMVDFMFYPAATYKSSISPKVALTVQLEPILPWPSADLPKSYWQRPIYGENREWYSIAGNWLMPWYNATFMFGGFNPYTKAPDTAHVVWKKPIMFGGIIGGEFGTKDYYTGLSYEWRFQPIIMQGRLYYNRPMSSSFSDGLVCVDLRTGEELWFKEDVSVSLAQIYVYDSPNQHGGIPYLWSTSGTTWKMYDAFTGDWICDIAGAPPSGFFTTISNKIVYGKDGSLLVYMLDGANNWLLLWNSSKAIPPMLPFGPVAWMWRPPLGGTLDWKQGIEWNITIPKVTTRTLSLNKVGSGVLLAYDASFGGAENVTYVAFNMTDGHKIWNKTFDITPGSNEGYFGSSNTPLLYGVFERFTKSTMQFHGIDAFTGNELWVTEPFTNAWGMYDETGAAAYGIFYTMAYDGTIHAYNITTGEHLWDYYTGSSGFETVYGHWPFYVINGWAIADGKVYAPTGEHSPDSPLGRGYRLHVVDAFNGKPVWNISGYWQFPAIADGYLVLLNGYDNSLYCFGKGLTSVELSTSPKVVTEGSSILIEGKVLDESPAIKGTPCVADENMSPWMEYLVMQKPMPETVSGVMVELYAISETGATTKIGTATTDPLNGGIFSLLWTPPEKGTYTITAVFAGSKSYWDSYTSTAIGVTEAPTPSATAEQAQTIQSSTESLQSRIDTMQTILIIIIVIVILLVAYDIYINRKMLRQAAK